MKIAICDDEQTDRTRLLEYCRRYNAKLDVTLVVSGAALLAAFENVFFDIVLLDIEMEKPNGFETALELRSRAKKPIIIFTTQNLNYAVRGYGVALRYLPKPISYEAFSPVLKLAINQVIPPKVTLTHADGQLILTVSEVLFYEVFGHKVLIHIEGKPTLKIRSTMSDISAQLQKSYFVQTHKSFCVNLNYVDRIEQNDIVLTNGERIPLSRRKKDLFSQQLTEHLRELHKK